MLSVRHWRIGVYAASRLWLFPLAYGIGEFAKHKTVADIPSYARKLPCPVGRSCDSLSKLRRHLSVPWTSLIVRPRLCIANSRVKSCGVRIQCRLAIKALPGQVERP